MKIDKSRMAPTEKAMLEDLEKRYGVEDGGAVAEAEEKAADLMKHRPNLTKAQAVDAVLQADPDLARRYEAEG